MERVIKLLVEYDNRGRELVQQAQQARLEALARLDEDKRAIQQQMRVHAAERVEQVRQQAQRDRDEALPGCAQRMSSGCRRCAASIRRAMTSGCVRSSAAASAGDGDAAQ